MNFLETFANKLDCDKYIDINLDNNLLKDFYKQFIINDYDDIRLSKIIVSKYNLVFMVIIDVDVLLDVKHYFDYFWKCSITNCDTITICYYTLVIVVCKHNSTSNNDYHILTYYNCNSRYVDGDYVDNCNIESLINLFERDSEKSGFDKCLLYYYEDEFKQLRMDLHEIVFKNDESTYDELNESSNNDYI